MLAAVLYIVLISQAALTDNSANLITCNATKVLLPCHFTSDHRCVRRTTYNYTETSVECVMPSDHESPCDKKECNETCSDMPKIWTECNVKCGGGRSYPHFNDTDYIMTVLYGYCPFLHQKFEDCNPEICTDSIVSIVLICLSICALGFTHFVLIRCVIWTIRRRWHIKRRRYETIRRCSPLVRRVDGSESEKPLVKPVKSRIASWFSNIRRWLAEQFRFVFVDRQTTSSE